MEYQIIHNFCESRLNENIPPELLNSYTSLFITFIPIYYGFPKQEVFYNISCMLVFNGFASFYYHYSLNWIGKQADEISMILSVYFGIWGLLKIYYLDNQKNINFYNGINNIYLLLMIIFNTVLKYDYLFPFIFSLYIVVTLILMYKINENNNNSQALSYKYEIVISSFGAISWIISEIHCTEFTKYGHVAWHLLFPLGFYKLILKYDNYINKLIS